MAGKKGMKAADQTGARRRTCGENQGMSEQDRQNLWLQTGLEMAERPKYRKKPENSA